MPPKKAKAAAPASGDDSNDGGKVGWTVEADRKLLILSMGRTLTPADYHEIVKVMPGRSFHGVRQRIGKFRAEQRKFFEEYGWKMPDAGAPSTTTPRKPTATAADTPKSRKRGKKDNETEDGPADDEVGFDAVKRVKVETGEGFNIKEEQEEDAFV